MTTAEARQIAQSDPVPVLTARWGEATAVARQRVAHVIDSLRELETLKDQLAGHDLTIATDLGPVGNSAMATWRDLQQENNRDFALPRVAA